ncbi:hypothetical protein tf_30 [Pseudomonas phage tf]|uniref:Uncharacterized protein n=1 Tax=Pseudomonas phage tf TaxID=1114179 RepID=J7S5G5_9CAUD|nr:hypothetical protein tf_30 [Pseudomonas phage tf]CCL97938.1 hypothetical protein tf_30 [Pseudomonas phage tf]
MAASDCPWPRTLKTLGWILRKRRIGWLVQRVTRMHPKSVSPANEVYFL